VYGNANFVEDNKSRKGTRLKRDPKKRKERRGDKKLGGGRKIDWPLEDGFSGEGELSTLFLIGDGRSTNLEPKGGRDKAAAGKDCL